MATKAATDIDTYIAGFPQAAVREALEAVRRTVRDAAPGAVEAIKYNMPTFVLDGRNLVHFAGYRHHIGFYPAPAGSPGFEEALAGYKTGKGSVQFPLNAPMPLDLVEKIVRFRMGERE